MVCLVTPVTDEINQTNKMNQINTSHGFESSQNFAYFMTV